MTSKPFKTLTVLKRAVCLVFILSLFSIPCLAAESVSVSVGNENAVIREDGTGVLVLELPLSGAVSADSYEFSLVYDGDVLSLRSMEGPTEDVSLKAVTGSDRIVGISSASSDVSISSLGTLTFDLLKKGDATVTIAGETSWINRMASVDTTSIASADSCVKVACENPGDTNGDKLVDLLDMVRLMKYLADVPSVTVADSSADVNGDGLEGSADIVRLAQFIANPTEVVIY